MSEMREMPARDSPNLSVRPRLRQLDLIQEST